MQTSKYNQEDILQFIPQRKPFVMVGKINETGADYLITNFDIKEVNVLANNGNFSEGGMVENIAQTAAIFAGIKAQSQGKPTPLGYIASIKSLEIDEIPSCNTRITTKITLASDLMNIQVVKGEIHDQEGQKLASCELRIFIKEE